MSEFSVSAPSKQIRPKVRSRTSTHARSSPGRQVETANTGAARLDPNNDDRQVEETRQRMESWMGLGASQKNNENSYSGSSVIIQRPAGSASHALQPSLAKEPLTTSRPAKSILKTPKYTKTVTPQNPTIATTIKEDMACIPRSTKPPISSLETSDDEVAPTTDIAPSGHICKNIVVERDPTKPMLKRKIKSRAAATAQSHSAVEGYTPSLAASVPSTVASTETHTSPNREEKEMKSGDGEMTAAPGQLTSREEEVGDESAPLILNSLEDLFLAAGETLPPKTDPNKITEDTKLLEANISFSVMTKEQYNGKLTELKEQYEEERQDQLRVFLGTENIFDEDEEEDDNNSHSSDGDEEDDLMDMLMGGDDEENDEYFEDDGVDQVEERQPRAFRLLWETMAEWVTPEAARYISHLTAAAKATSEETKWTSPVIERSDIEASRCAGLMAMVKLYLPKSLEELGYSSELRRTADLRLGELLRTFCYVLEAPKIPVKLWKTMTCILLEIVMVEYESNSIAEGKLPSSVMAVNMTSDEYRYLAQSAMRTFIFSE